LDPRSRPEGGQTALGSARPETAPRSDPGSGEGHWPTISAVVLAHNRRDQLAITLGKLRDELDYARARLEVIVVDNASQDGTADMVRDQFPEVSLLTNETNLGISAWNLGFAHGSGDYFLALDDDCYMTGNSLLEAVAMAERQDADLVSFVARSTREPGHVFNDEYNPGLLAFWGCAALLSRRAVRTLGGFDDGIFVWAHEAEFTMRLFDRGLRHLFAPQIEVHHMVASASRLTPFFYTQNTRNLAYIAAKLLRAHHVAPVLANLTTAAVLRALTDWRTAGSILAVPQGARAGFRRRSPVRSSVSTLYRSSFVDFVSPLRFVRGTGMTGFTARRHRFADERRHLYPTDAAWLEV